MIKKNIAFTDRMNDMVEELKEKKGYMSFSAVIHQAIVDMHNKTFPAYVREPAARETPEERVRRQGETKKAKEEARRAELVEIADELGGTVTQEAGGEFVSYYTYSGKKRYEVSVPLDQLSSDLVKTQYFPSKEKVLKLQAEGKVDY